MSFECRANGIEETINVTLLKHEAVVIDRKKRVTLRFVSSIWPRMEDVYEGEGHLLTFDPEGWLERSDGSRFGPCQ